MLAAIVGLRGCHPRELRHDLTLHAVKLRHPFKDTRIYVLEPSNDHAMVSQVTIEKDRVRAWARLGVPDMDEFLRRPLDI